MAIISSKSNDHIKFVKRLSKRSVRDKENLFFVEGIRLTEEALKAEVQTLFFTAKAVTTPRGRELVERAKAARMQVVECTESVFADITDTVNSQGVLAVVKKRDWPVDLRGLVVVADGIQDPGNMGVLFRTALGAGAGGIVVTAGSVDPYNPKAVRSSMGGILELPHWQMDHEEAIASLKDNKFTIVVADLQEAVDYFSIQFPENTALVIGNEARGPSDRLRSEADFRVKIPLIGSIESLNASVAAGILMYEIVRQKLMH